jgi:hypothetical protein
MVSCCDANRSDAARGGGSASLRYHARGSGGVYDRSHFSRGLGPELGPGVGTRDRNADPNMFAAVDEQRQNVEHALEVAIPNIMSLRLWRISHGLVASLGVTEDTRTDEEIVVDRDDRGDRGYQSA